MLGSSGLTLISSLWLRLWLKVCNRCLSRKPPLRCSSFSDTVHGTRSTFHSLVTTTEGLLLCIQQYHTAFFFSLLSAECNLVEDIRLCLKYINKIKLNTYSVWQNYMFILLLLLLATSFGSKILLIFPMWLYIYIYIYIYMYLMYLRLS